MGSGDSRDKDWESLIMQVWIKEHMWRHKGNLWFYQKAIFIIFTFFSIKDLYIQKFVDMCNA